MNVKQPYVTIYPINNGSEVAVEICETPGQPIKGLTEVFNFYTFAFRYVLNVMDLRTSYFDCKESNVVKRERAYNIFPVGDEVMVTVDGEEFGTFSNYELALNALIKGINHA